MKTYEISASLLIEAPATVIYSIIADYHHGHPEILPKPPFDSLEVIEGGIGDGTVIRVGIKVLGKHQEFRSVIMNLNPAEYLLKQMITDMSQHLPLILREEPCNHL